MSTADLAADWNERTPGGRCNEPDTRSFSTHPKHRPHLTADRLSRLEAIEEEMAGRLEQVLGDRVGDVAILSRVGSDLSAQPFRGEVPRYTHSAYVLRHRASWQIVHVLNVHAGPDGELSRQPLIDFIRDDPWKYRFEVMTLASEVEERVSEALATPLPRQVFRRPYSAIAHPRSDRYQQSNQWLVEFLGSCLLGRGDETRAGVQALLHEHGLRPSVIRKRALAGFAGQWAYRAVSRNLRFDDHPIGRRAVGDFAFISSTTVRDLLIDNGWLADHQEVFAGTPLGASCPDDDLIGSADL